MKTAASSQATPRTPRWKTTKCALSPIVAVAPARPVASATTSSEIGMAATAATASGLAREMSRSIRIVATQRATTKRRFQYSKASRLWGTPSRVIATSDRCDRKRKSQADAGGLQDAASLTPREVEEDRREQARADRLDGKTDQHLFHRECFP